MPLDSLRAVQYNAGVKSFEPSNHPSPPATVVGSARRATSLMFIIDGAGFGVWAALLPALQTRHGLSEAELGGALFGMVAGAVLAMSGIGRIIAAFGSARALAFVAPLYALALVGPALAPTFACVVVAATLFGLFKGSFDVSVNAQALTVENAAGRPIMASFQACWSLGGLGAALLAGGALRFGFSPAVITLAAAGGLFVAGIMSFRRLLPEPMATASGTGRGIFHPAILPVGVLAFTALFTEGVLMDWGAVYAANVAGAAAWLAPLAYGAFCSAMAFGRLVGDRLVARMGATTMLRLSGALTVAGLILVVSVHAWPATFVGLLIAGLGLSNLVPIFLKAAGAAHPAGPAQGVAAVSSIGYIGFLSGPPIIGWMSSGMGLPLAFAAVALLASMIAFQGPSLLNRSRMKRSTVVRKERRVDLPVSQKEVTA